MFAYLGWIDTSVVSTTSKRYVEVVRGDLRLGGKEVERLEKPECCRRFRVDGRSREPAGPKELLMMWKSALARAVVD